MMENERSLTTRFVEIEKQLADARILLEKGKANELPFFIFDYDPKDELKVRDEVEKLKKNNPNIQEFDLFDIVVELLKNEGYLEDIKFTEKEYDNELLLDQMFRPFLSLEEDDNPVMRYIEEHVSDDGNHITLITGVGKAYPIVRSHTILNRLQTIVKKNPVVMMYPGRYDLHHSMCLRLFDRLADDNYYRAFPLEERMSK